MEEFYEKLLDHIVDQSNSLDNEKVLKS